MEETLASQSEAPAVICLGIAGVDCAEDAAVIRGIMPANRPKAPALIVNDALIALEAGAGIGQGIVIIAGTGSICYGRNERGQAARSGGWGPVLADEGSGSWIGQKTVRAVMRPSTPHHRQHGPLTNPRPAAFVGQDGPIRRTAPPAALVTSVADRSRAGDDDDARADAGASLERDQRVVDDQTAALWPIRRMMPRMTAASSARSTPAMPRQMTAGTSDATPGSPP